MRTIDADSLKTKLITYMDAFVDDDGDMMYSDHLLSSADYKDLCEFIDEQPTVEAHISETNEHTDMIDRQKAIKVIKDLLEAKTDRNNDTYGKQQGLYTALCAIMDLPTVN